MKKLLLSVFLLIFATFTYGQKNKAFANPTLIYGSDFGNFFKTMYVQQNYDTLLYYTSKKSIKKFGKENLLKYYKDIDFAYVMKLKSKTVHNDTITLSYVAMINATQRIVKLDVVVENDTCRLLVDNILFHLGVTEDMVNDKKFTTK